MHLLDSAPEGPIEIDPNLLYHHDASDSDDDNSASTSTLHSHHSQPPNQQQQQAWNRSQTRAQRRVHELRQEQEQKELSECTFNPRTGRSPTGPKQQQYRNMPVEDRLLAQSGLRRQHVAHRVQQEREEAEKVDCTFTPKILTPPEQFMKRPMPPIHQRLNDEWRRQREAMEEAKRRAQKEDGVSFQPALNKKSLKIVELKMMRPCSSTDNNDDEKRHCRRNMWHDDQVKEEERTCTFQPQTNPTSQRILEQSTTVPSDFFLRQRYFDRQRQLKQVTAKQMDHRNAEEGTFNPSCYDSAGGSSNCDTILAFSNRRFEQLLEAPEQRWERLAFEEPLQRQIRLQAKAAEIRAQEAPFQPEINPNSIKLAVEKATTRGGGEKEKIQRSAVFLEECRQSEMKECTFIPDISKPRVVGYYEAYMPPQPNSRLDLGAGTEAQQRKKDKEAWAASIRAERERKEMDECTFEPKILNTSGRNTPAPVAGMDKYIEWKRITQQKKAVEEARIAKLFHMQQPHGNRNEGGGWKRTVTVPRPFRLQTEERRK